MRDRLRRHSNSDAIVAERCHGEGLAWANCKFPIWGRSRKRLSAKQCARKLGALTRSRIFSDRRSRAGAGGPLPSADAIQIVAPPPVAVNTTAGTRRQGGYFPHAGGSVSATPLPEQQHPRDQRPGSSWRRISNPRRSWLDLHTYRNRKATGAHLRKGLARRRRQQSNIRPSGVHRNTAHPLRSLEQGAAVGDQDVPPHTMW